jgi:V/A-type H+-transporting ATPase subunit I
MFGDVGHGLVLLLFGLFLLYRKAPFLKSWGQMFSISGIVAIFFGILIGEAFGIELHKVIPIESIAHLDFIENPIIHFIHRSEGHLPSIEIAALRTFLKISLLLGILHLTIGNLISIYNDVKNREYDELIVETFPVFAMFVGFVFFMFSFIGTEFQIDQLFISQREAPLFFITERFLPGFTSYLTVPIATLSLYSVSLLLAGFFVLIIGKPVLIITGRVPKESIPMAMLVQVIDGGIEKIAGSLSNILSYTRLAVLLTVHSSLLIVVNLALDLPLFIAVPMFILLNIIVLLLEGLIVYIQNLRLHLYEWFSKFYSGSGAAFKVFPSSPNNNINTHIKLKWKHSN